MSPPVADVLATSAAIARALDVTAVVLAAAAAVCAWRSCRWMSAHAPGVAVGAGIPADPEAPLVSLLIPARDEAGNVGNCLRSLLAQTHPAFEVLVLDDGSRDATAAIARAVIAASADPGRGRVLAGGALPSGWGGKNRACHLLAEAARGEWLFFLDADTRLEPDGVARALIAARSADAEFASFLPRYTGAHWVNRVAVPSLYFFLTALIPLPEVRRLAHPRLAVANGQAILVRRDAYARIGGHAAVRDHIVEDVSLAIAAKTRGVVIALLDGSGWLRCAMYDSAGGYARGLGKSFHSAARRYPLQWAALTVLLALLGLWPWLRALAGPGDALPLAITAIAITTATQAGLLRRFRQSLAALVAWPIALASVLAISVAAGISGLAGRPVSWRGRAVGGTAPS